MGRRFLKRVQKLAGVLFHHADGAKEKILDHSLNLLLKQDQRLGSPEMTM